VQTKKPELKKARHSKEQSEAVGKRNYPLKYDLVFKMVFSERRDLLTALIESLLGLKQGSMKVEDCRIENPENYPESIKDKFCIFDLKVRVGNRLLNIEVQQANQGNFRDRSLFHASKLVANSIESGRNYKTMPQCIAINIVDFALFRKDRFYRRFTLREDSDYKEVMSPKLAVYFFDLRHAPESTDTTDRLALWCYLFNAETDEDYDRLRRLEVGMVTEAIETIKRVTSSEAFRELERMREKAALDFEQARYSAEKRGERRGRKEGRLEGIQEGRLEGRLEGILQTAGNMLAEGFTKEQIEKVTGLSSAEIRKLRNSYGH
jgi:predicted transposase/invertase (TIGR01784 family)